MATYAVGDIQGCYHSFLQLLDEISFDPSRDQLWLVGDIINRGANSLEVLRWVVAHREQVICVLGNHDLHALVVAAGFVRMHRSDTLQALLHADDRDELLDWLRHQKMLHAEQGYIMVHAGLLPEWTMEQALALSKEVEHALQGVEHRTFLRHMYGNQPTRWHDNLEGIDRLRVITNAMTRLRICRADGEMEFHYKATLSGIPDGYMPWFDVPDRKTRSEVVIFGHWSALGLQQRNNVVALDTGCLWNGKLTAFRLNDHAIFQVPCHPLDAPRNLECSD